MPLTRYTLIKMASTDHEFFGKLIAGQLMKYKEQIDELIQILDEKYDKEPNSHSDESDKQFISDKINIMSSRTEFYYSDLNTTILDEFNDVFTNLSNLNNTIILNQSPGDTTDTSLNVNQIFEANYNNDRYLSINCVSNFLDFNTDVHENLNCIQNCEHLQLKDPVCGESAVSKLSKLHTKDKAYQPFNNIMFGNLGSPGQNYLLRKLKLRKLLSWECDLQTSLRINVRDLFSTMFTNNRTLLFETKSKIMFTNRTPKMYEIFSFKVLPTKNRGTKMMGSLTLKPYYNEGQIYFEKELLDFRNIHASNIILWEDVAYQMKLILLTCSPKVIKFNRARIVFDRGK